MKNKTVKEKCPHLNCLVYHEDGVCNCEMQRFCRDCSMEHFLRENPLVLDDDIPDKFEEWVTTK